MGLFREVTPLVEPLSLDEAFLDVSGAGRLLGRPEAIAWDLRRARVLDQEGLNCSVGVATVQAGGQARFREAAKPRVVENRRVDRRRLGVRVVEPPHRATDFLRPLADQGLVGGGTQDGRARLRSLRHRHRR